MSATPDFVVKRNDYGDREPLRVILEQLKVDAETGEPILDEDGNEQWEPIDLTGTTTRILLKSTTTVVKTSPMTTWGGGALTNDGKAEYHFEKAAGEEPADLGTAGDYQMEFEITSAAAAAIQSVPNEGYLLLRVEVDLGP